MVVFVFANVQAYRQALDSLQGEVMSNALDFIAKEVVRVSEERKIASLVAQATRVRRIREAEESGRRQAEDILRRKREQHFAEVPLHCVALLLHVPLS